MNYDTKEYLSDLKVLTSFGRKTSLPPYQPLIQKGIDELIRKVDDYLHNYQEGEPEENHSLKLTWAKKLYTTAMLIHMESMRREIDRLNAHIDEREADVKGAMHKLWNHANQDCLDIVSIEDALRMLEITL